MYLCKTTKYFATPLNTNMASDIESVILRKSVTGIGHQSAFKVHVSHRITPKPFF